MIYFDDDAERAAFAAARRDRPLLPTLPLTGARFTDRALEQARVNWAETLSRYSLQSCDLWDSAERFLASAAEADKELAQRLRR